MCDITQCLYLWYHTLYVYDISTLYGIKHSVLTTQPLCNFTATMSDITPQYLCPHTQWINFIKPSVCMTSQPLCVWHRMHYVWHHIHNIGHHTTLCMTSGPLYLTSLPVYLCHNIHPIDDITATYVWSHIQYLWHHIHYIYDIIPLSMTSQHSVLMMQHSAYVWHRLHCRWQCTHSITPNHSMYDITSTSGRTAQPLYETSHPLYLCHHTVYTDISPTFVWHNTHFCVTPYELYITSTQSLCHHTTVLMTSQPLYMKIYPVCGQHIHLTCDITATICVITPTV